ncbi:pentatricopeptide repeat-containing protein [Pyrus ussuriensis x Pyrus communis]|uniref:Pentatricopeptide repeat-containing protein n=1 Tax=Pyrus ussuriensis x Pyrus communis TaxID=2448454 RepID=A0A5N5HEI0_9ROSA|nr:pentatricopeptide repeat-containing protein [Pyrus ussuriensis x Pyrus communis]
MSSLRCIAKHPTIALVDTYSTLRELKQIHSQLLVNGLLNDRHLSGHFVAAIALRNPTNLDYSNQVLDQCQNPTLFAFNSMIRAYSKSSTPSKSFNFYSRILRSSDNLSPDNYTFNFLVRTCAQLLARETGPTVHGGLIKHGFENDPHVQSGLIFMYAELGSLDPCRRVFREIVEPDLVCQTAMVSACARCGDVGFARELFDEMPQRDPVAWNAMIAGYAQCGKSREALNLFHLMQMEGVRVNEVYMVSVLSACSHMGALDQGRCAHAYIERNKVRMTVTLGTALIDMCFGMKEKNVYTWSSALGGLAMNGLGEKRLKLFSLMNKEGVHPNEVTFVLVLKGCTVVGLVEKGRHFDSMRKSCGIEPQLEHCGCVLDLYGHAGRVDEALNFINNMPMKPWGALLNASRIYKNMEIVELASRKIVELEAKNHGAYVLLSNIYADSKLWDEVSNVRLTMKAKGVRKLPGCSVLEVDGHNVGRNLPRLKLASYVANTNPVLFDIEEEEKGFVVEITVRDWNRFHHLKDDQCSCKGYW